MAHWAQINENNLVTQVLVTDNEDPNGDEGYQFLIDTFGGTWIQTSYNTMNNVHLLGGIPLRGNYAGVGFIYNETLDFFMKPKPFDSWVANEATADWVAPIPQPDFAHVWNEEIEDWELGDAPYVSWTYDSSAGNFVAPEARPQDGKLYRWNEPTLNWVEITGE
jgi:hypothetical protein